MYGGGLSAALKDTRRNCTARDGIVAAVANLGPFDKGIPARAARSRRVLFEAAGRPPSSTPTVFIRLKFKSEIAFDETRNICHCVS
ncbi:hypothetical protein Y032_0175g504 [Ancylostoma ceylanicum]|uniref:Uncharacterized protein n=1 Tax=Ancylostoma ceylanicum TaxID=53326 RepID=A0A016SUS0_9BILA|nr:hypothetical protein Y032_0175g504 [Ancylostoma ceylanicum]